jgi:hypothetical protein
MMGKKITGKIPRLLSTLAERQGWADRWMVGIGRRRRRNSQAFEED